MAQKLSLLHSIVHPPRVPGAGLEMIAALLLTRLRRQRSGCRLVPMDRVAPDLSAQNEIMHQVLRGRRYYTGCGGIINSGKSAKGEHTGRFGATRCNRPSGGPHANRSCLSKYQGGASVIQRIKAEVCRR